MTPDETMQELQARMDRIMGPDPHELLTPVEVAAILRCSPKTVARHRLRGRLKAEKQSPRVFRYRRSDVDFFRDQCREDANLSDQ